MERSDGLLAGRARLAADIAAYALDVPAPELMARTRGTAEAAFARQVAMYLTHTAFAVSLAGVAQAFGRDRSTVSHACRLIEDKRDEAAFDDWIGDLEDMLRQAPRPRRAPANGQRAA